MTNTERKTIHLRLLRMLDERSALPWWAWRRRVAMTRLMHELADRALA